MKIVKPPQVRSLPDILAREETLDVINITHKLRYRVFFITVYSIGLRLGERLQLKVSDIDWLRHRIHIRCAKGGKDPFGHCREKSETTPVIPAIKHNPLLMLRTYAPSLFVSSPSKY